MTTHPSSRSRSPAPAPPLEDENLLAEILLRLPADPSSLPRASAVCKRWGHLVSDRRFFRRFRLHHRHNPPLLGFFHTFRGSSFERTLEAPNRVAPGRFSLQLDRDDSLLPLGSRHGLVLLLDRKRKQVLVWDPVTGDQDRISLPPRFEDDPHANGAVLRVAGDEHFQVVLVVAVSDEELHRGVLGCVYSSETGLWGNLMSTLFTSINVLPHEYCGLSQMPAVLVGHSLYWTLVGDFPGFLELDLEMQSLAVIPLPTDRLSDFELTAMRAESGGLGFLLFSKMVLDIQLWKRKTDCDGVVSWERGRTIELGNALPLNSVRDRMFVKIFGFAECNNAVFLVTRKGIFMVHLESLESKKFLQVGGYCLPFESVYAAGT